VVQNWRRSLKGEGRRKKAEKDKVTQGWADAFRDGYEEYLND
jgi:hypothetical protein